VTVAGTVKNILCLLSPKISKGAGILTEISSVGVPGFKDANRSNDRPGYYEGRNICFSSCRAICCRHHERKMKPVTVEMGSSIFFQESDRHE